MAQASSNRRDFLAGCGTVAATAALGGFGARRATAAPAETPASGKATTGRRVGAVAYAFQYSLGLFTYKDRPGPRMDTLGFLEATRQAGGSVAQIFGGMLDKADEDELQRIRRRAAELDMLLEVHGGVMFSPRYEQTMQKTSALGAKVIGCSSGMLMRPNVIDTLAGWEEHTARSKARLRELAAQAKSLGLTIGVENHLDFSVGELEALIRAVDSPNVGVMFDVGNTIGSLDDSCEAADALGPLTVATHYKDFTVEEVTRGFRFTMVPLGAGNLQLAEITQRLLKHLRPEVALSIEMMNGQQFEVPWLLERFWATSPGKPGREVAATLRHIRGKAADLSELRPQDEIDRLPHEAHMRLESDRIAHCIAHLKNLVQTAEAKP